MSLFFIYLLYSSRLTDYLEKYFKKLTGNRDIEDSLERLDKLTQEEALMASAEQLKMTHSVDGKVMGVDNRVRGVKGQIQDVLGDIRDVGNKVQNVEMSIQDVRSDMHDVGNKVQGVEGRVQDVQADVQDVGNKILDVDDRVQGIEYSVRGVDGKLDQSNRSLSLNLDSYSAGSDNFTGIQLRNNLLRWLSPPDPSINHNIACKTYHNGTAQWFFQGIIFNRWKSAGSLWVHGNVCGFLSSLKAIPDHLFFFSWVRKKCPVVCPFPTFSPCPTNQYLFSSSIIADIIALRDAGRASMAYFYFDFGDDDKQKLQSLVSSLLIQLSARSDACHEILSELYSSHDREERNPSDREMVACLKEMLVLEARGPTYIIMDALDECPITSTIPSPREEVLELVVELVNLHLPNLHICVTSRPEHDIQIALESLTENSVSLHDESGQQEDIANYVASFVHSNQRMRRWREEDKNLVVKTLSEKADGM